jgi:hypothetical protein
VDRGICHPAGQQHTARHDGSAHKSTSNQIHPATFRLRHDDMSSDAKYPPASLSLP